MLCDVLKWSSVALLLDSELPGLGNQLWNWLTAADGESGLPVVGVSVCVIVGEMTRYALLQIVAEHLDDAVNLVDAFHLLQVVLAPAVVWVLLLNDIDNVEVVDTAVGEANNEWDLCCVGRKVGEAIVTVEC